MKKIMHNLSMKKLFLVIFLLIFINLPANAIKIGLQDGVFEARIGTSVQGFILNNQNKTILHKTEPRTEYKIFPYKNMLGIEIKGNRYKLNTNAILVETSSIDSFVFAKKRWYRGKLLIYNYAGALIVINDIPLEEYLLGVVPSEMPSNWNVEAHKAQAIAARSYALSNLGKRKKHGYDLIDTPIDQAYKGAEVETQRTNYAVASTKGIVMTYNSRIITAYYHASAGGHTKNSGDVWTKNLPYLKSVESYDWGKRKFGHGVGMSQYGANYLANKGYTGYQILNHFYNNVSYARVKNTNI